MARKALIAGVNDYAPVGPGGPDLRGCIADVKDMVHTLNALEIVPAKPGSMRILTNEHATRDNILEGIKWLIGGAKKGDVLIFHYSGHGSQVADTSKAEIDGKDETLCPHDYATAGMIKDDDLLEHFTGIADGVTIDVVLDCCHAGSGTRELAALGMAPEEESITYRYIEPPLEYGMFLDENPDIPLRGFLKPKKGQKEIVAVPGLNHVLWAGCRENQTSAEAPINGLYRGVFTYCYCKVLRRVCTDITRRELDTKVSGYIKTLGYAQVPQLEGTIKSIAEKVFT